MKIENEFTVSVPIERAWDVLTDLAGIAPCMPGAQLTGVEGDVYSGKVKVKVGPVTSEYAGTARFVEKDDGGEALASPPFSVLARRVPAIEPFRCLRRRRCSCDRRAPGRSRRETNDRSRRDKKNGST